jgi:prepilin-type N-terminal cleavage/methylation domain-containing protein
MKDRMEARGRTLLELVVVMTIVGVLVSLGAGLGSAATRQRSRAVRTEVAAELRTARHLAMTGREKIRVVFDAEAAELRSERTDEARTVVRRYRFGGTGIHLDGLSNGGSVIFYPSGRSATPTTITFGTGSGEQWRITVSITGRISILQGA